MKMLCVRVVCLGEACLFGVEGSWRAEQLAQQVGQRWGLRDVRLSLEDGTQVPGELALGLCCEERGTRLHAQGRAEREERREEKRENNSNDIDVKRSSEWVRLNVGGVHVVTTRSTLCRDANSMLARMFAADSPWAADRTDATGAVLLDLEARYFMPVLHFLRFGRLVLDAGVSEAGVRDVAAFLQVQGVLQQLQHLPGRRNDSASGAAHFMLPNSAAAAADVQQLTPKIKYHNVMILACRLASWIGLSGAVPLSVPLKFKFSATRKYGNEWERFSHSNELVALILNELVSLGWWVVSSSAGGAGGDISVYQSYLLASDNTDVVQPETPEILAGDRPSNATNSATTNNSNNNNNQ